MLRLEVGDRTAFMKTATEFAGRHDLEGIDFEYVCQSLAFDALKEHLPAGNISNNNP